ncbi:hypothetical protein ES703_116518 [subsurface metagenome]
MVGERYMEFLRNVITQVTINTFIEEQLPTPATGNENMAMLIHMIIGSAEPGLGEVLKDVELIAAIHDRSMTLTGGWRYPGTLMYHHYGINATLSAAGLVYKREDSLQVVYFNPPVLYAKSFIYHALNSEECAHIRSHEIAIGYTLEKVSKDAFIAALVS